MSKGELLHPETFPFPISDKNDDNSLVDNDVLPGEFLEAVRGPPDFLFLSSPGKQYSYYLQSA